MKCKVDSEKVVYLNKIIAYGRNWKNCLRNNTKKVWDPGGFIAGFYQSFKHQRVALLFGLLQEEEDEKPPNWFYEATVAGISKADITAGIGISCE